MENCLVSKLIVECNEPLPILGKILVIQNVSAETYNNWFAFSETSDIEFVNCTYNGSNKLRIYTSPSTTALSKANFVLNEGETEAKYLVPFYKLSKLELNTPQILDCYNIKYMTNLQSLKTVYQVGYGFIGDTSVLSDLGIQMTLKGVTSGNDIDITVYGDNGKSWCVDFGTSSDKIVGSFNNLGKKAGSFNTIVFPRKRIEHSIDFDIFVRNAVNAGVTSKSITSSFHYTTIKFNGATLPDGGYDTVLSWEPAEQGKTKITFKGEVLGIIDNVA